MTFIELKVNNELTYFLQCGAGPVTVNKSKWTNEIRCLTTIGGWCTALFIISFGALANVESGKAIYDKQCALCHEGNLPEAPRRAGLKKYSAERVVEALSTGVMSTQGIQLSKQDMENVALFLTGKAVSKAKTHQVDYCEADLQLGHQSVENWNGWGGNKQNSRYVTNVGNLNKTHANKLTLEWVYAFPDTTRMRSQPIIIGSTIFMGSQEGKVYAIDADSGCTHWTFSAEAEVRGGIYAEFDKNGVLDNLLFGDFKANAYSIDAKNGQVNWKTQISNHPLASITGSVTAHNNLVYVPLSSSEVISAARENYACCSFRGAVVAVNIKTGEKVWEQFTTEPPKPTYENAQGIMQQGPSGAPIWSRPTVDHKRNLLYVTTGQNYSTPATHTSDAVIAMSLLTGELVWVAQLTKNDAWNGGCVRQNSNCPKENGPDFDSGTGAILVETEQRGIVLAGQKSGNVFALDADNGGEVLWKRRVGSGGTMGGVHWGMSASDSMVFAGVSDLPTNNPYIEGAPHPGVAAIDIISGELVWQRVLDNTCDKDDKFACYPGISAAVTATKDLVFAGGLDGKLHIFDSQNGTQLWTFDTRKSFKSLNKVSANGGSIEADGALVHDGDLFITSGYDKWGEIPGNVLLKFRVNME